MEQRSETRTETNSTVSSTTNTEYVHDSVFVYVGDTVVITRWRTSWRDRVIHDTVFKHTTDTVHETNDVEKVVQVPTKGSSAGWAVALALMLLIVVYILIKSFLK